MEHILFYWSYFHAENYGLLGLKDACKFIESDPIQDSWQSFSHRSLPREHYNIDLFAEDVKESEKGLLSC